MPGVAWETVPAAEQIGQELHDLTAELHPICRSLTGEGVRGNVLHPRTGAGTDGEHSLLDISDLSGLPCPAIREAADTLREHVLLEDMGQT